MYYQEIPVHRALSGYVRSYYSFCAPAPKSAVDHLIHFPSDGGPELLFNLDDAFTAGAGPAHVTSFDGTRIIGPLTRNLQTRTSARTAIVGIRFLPGKGSLVLGFPLGDLVDGTASIETIWGPAGKTLDEKIRNAQNPAEIKLHLDTALLARLNGQSTAHAPVFKALEAITRLKGQVRIQSLSRAVGLGQRQLERRFSEIVGLTPKRLCRITRFTHALSCFDAYRTRGWAGLAAAGGYSDQAHLIRECRFFTGHSPLAYLRYRSPLEKAIRGNGGGEMVEFQNNDNELK